MSRRHELSDEWLRSERAKQKGLEKSLGIVKKQYHYLKYNSRGVLEEYQETSSSPVFVKKKGKWVEKPTPKQPKKEK